MKPAVLLKYKSLELWYEPELTGDVEDSVKNTILGNPNGLQYQHLDSVRKLHEIHPIHFFTLRRENVLNYVMALVERITHFKSSAYYTFNIRYVSFNQKLAKKITADRHYQSQRRLGNSFFKEGMRKHAESFPFTFKEGSNHPDKKLYYAYVEESNIRSMEFTRFFFEKVRQLTAVPFSRLIPRKNKNVSLLEEGELDAMITLLNKEYYDYTFYFMDRDEIRNNYYVLRKNNEIIMGAKVLEANWRLVNVPGFMGKILMFILPVIPFLSRLVKKNKFRFLTLDTVYCKSGQEQLLTVFFASIIAIKKIYTAFLYFDNEDPVYHKVKNLKKMGIFNRLYKGVNGAVLARFVNFSEEEKQDFFTHPVFISAYDMT